jgi:hypothetical protein
MPYVVIARVEPGTEPLVLGRVCRACPVQSNDGLMVHVVARSPFIAWVLRNAGWTPRTASTYQLKPVPGGPLFGMNEGPFPDVSAIKDAVERHTSDICAIHVSAQAPGP